PDRVALADAEVPQDVPGGGDVTEPVDDLARRHLGAGDHAVAGRDRLRQRHQVDAGEPGAGGVGDGPAQQVGEQLVDVLVVGGGDPGLELELAAQDVGDGLQVDGTGHRLVVADERGAAQCGGADRLDGGDREPGGDAGALVDL